MYSLQQIQHAASTARNIITLDIPNDCAYVTLTQGYKAIIDLQDVPLIAGYRWYAQKAYNTYYASTNYVLPDGESSTRRIQQIIMHDAVSTDPKTKIDHWNHDGLDNRRANLRPTTHQGNLQNCRRYTRSIHSDIQFRCVTRMRSKFVAAVQHDGVKHWASIRHRDADTAAMRADVMMLEIRGEAQPIHNLNFPHLSPGLFDIITDAKVNPPTNTGFSKADLDFNVPELVI